MTQEEKAKAYDEMTRLLSNRYKCETDIGIIDHISAIYPEIAESADEKIRKRLIEEMRRFQEEAAKESCDADFEFAKKAIAWLEKQGEQQLTDPRICQCNVDTALTETEGIRRITKERNRQIEKEGYDEEHDAQEPINRMVACAISYAMYDIDEQEADAWWEWDRQYFKPKDRLRNLERAGALIAAAIDKIVKEESGNNPSQEKRNFIKNII